jgi:thiol-disulfide isomerase/thioredoxin
MLRIILAMLCLVYSACMASGTISSENSTTPQDLTPTDVEDDRFMETLESIHDVDLEDLLPPSPITWKLCTGEVGDHPCNIEGPDHLGNNFGLYALYGRPIVLDFSAGWCGPCRNAAAHAQEVQDLYRDTGLAYITVLIETTNGGIPSQADVAEWGQLYGLTDSLAVAGSRGLLQSGGGAWVLSGWPTFYYSDREMILRDIDRGYSAQEVIHSIEWLLTL